MSSIFGGGQQAPQINFQPSGVSNPQGFNINTTGGVSESLPLYNNISGLQQTFGQQAQALGGLAQTVQPGFSQFRQAGLADIANAFQSNLSNLKQNLAQRGIAGSSFANSSLTNAAATQAQTQADFEAQSYLQELQASYQLIQSQYQAQTQSYQSAINQSNIESAAAASLVANNNAIGAQIATANAQLQMQQQAVNNQGLAGLGQFAGSILGLGLPGSTNAAGQAVSGGTLGGSLISGLGSGLSSLGASALGMGSFLAL